jgi:hypothetical protein
MPALADVQKAAGDFIAHRVSQAYLARVVSEYVYHLAKDDSREHHGAMIRIAQALFYMAPE